MNRNVYTLLTVAFIGSLLNLVQAETMEERKRRIMRKYMRERQDIVQGDFAMPEVVQEDARVIESEQFKELAQEFDQEQGVKMPQVVQPNQPVPMESERGWWLETAEMEEDAYANPFSSKAGGDEKTAESWSPWGQRDDSASYGSAYGEQRDVPDDTYWGGREGSFDAEASSRQWDPPGETYSGRQADYGIQAESGIGSSASSRDYGDFTSRGSSSTRESDQMSAFYRRRQTDTRAPDSRWGLDSTVRYGSSASPRLRQSTLPSPTDTQGWSSQNQIPGYTPYRSPYQDQGNGYRRYGDNMQSQPSQYTRPNNYQKWKDSNKDWDPTSGNLYLDELMRDERR